METNQPKQSEDPSRTVPTFTKIIDGKTYLVRIFFAPKGTETMEQKIMRMMRDEVLTKMKFVLVCLRSSVSDHRESSIEKIVNTMTSCSGFRPLIV